MASFFLMLPLILIEEKKERSVFFPRERKYPGEF
jgi:hypothetical protein